MRLMINAAVLAATLMFATPAVAMATGNAPLPSEARNDPEFMAWLTSLTEQVGEDEHYRRIPLDTEAQVAEFTLVLHKLFRGRITDAQFTGWMGVAYPGHEYEQAAILRILHVHWKASGR